MNVGAAARCLAAGAATAVLTAFLAGCAAGAGVEAANRGIDVYGVALGSTGVSPGIRQATAVEEPCLRGYERTYDELAVAVGYTHAGEVRKIKTRNPGTSMFGIRPGDDLESARSKALAAGFRESGAAHRFESGCCALTFTVDEDGRVFVLALELLR